MDKESENRIQRSMTMKDVSIEDRELFRNLIGDIKNSEYQFSTIFIWQKAYRFRFVVLDGALCIFGQQNDGSLQCYYPLGAGNQLLQTLDQVIQIFHELDAKYNFRPLSENMKESITAYLKTGYDIGSKESYSDYIYDFKRISSYSGSDYSRKRKEKNRFISKYNYCYETITQANLSECLASLIRIVESGDYDNAEVDAYIRAFNNYEELQLRGGCLRIDGIIEAIAVGEPLGDMVLMHIRRANKKYEGIYPAMLSFFLENEFSDYEYRIVNTQDDVGDPDIRRTKKSYRPIEITTKYYVKEK